MLAEDGEGRNPLAQRSLVALCDVEIFIHASDIHVNQNVVGFEQGLIGRVVKVPVENVAIGAPIATEIDQHEFMLGLGARKGESDRCLRVRSLVIGVRGNGRQRGVAQQWRGNEFRVDFLPKVKIDLVVDDKDTDAIINTICENARTGAVGDGKIWVTPVSRLVRVRTGETGEAAI